MIADRDTDRLLRAWFQEPAAPLPDHVLDTVLDGLPRLQQRRRWWPAIETGIGAGRTMRLLVVAAVILAIVAGLVIVAGSTVFGPRPRSFPGEGPLEPGRYVIDTPFPVRFAFDLGAGWVAVEHTTDTLSIDHGGASPDAELSVLLYDTIYAQPCRPEEGLLEPIGPTAGDLATAIRDAPGLGTTAMTATVIDGVPAFLVSVTRPGPFTGCRSETELLLFGLPHDYPILPDARHRFWILELEGRRVVVAARDGGAGSAGADDVDLTIGSLAFGVDPAPTDRPVFTPETSTAQPGPAETPFPLLPSSGRVPAGVYRFPMAPLVLDTAGRLVPLPGRYEGAFEVPDGWTSTGRGLVNGEPGAATASFAIWTIATVYRDPCRWRTGTLGPIGAAAITDVHALADALTNWWPPVPDRDVVLPGYTAPAGAPSASTPILQPWNTRPARELDLWVPADLELSACDDGEYRLWLDGEGVPRTAQPGEQVHIVAVDVEGAVLVINAAALPGADDSVLDGLGTMVFSTWIGSVE